MSRQRLRPSLSESTATICPRCNGKGTIRGVESLALSILRLIEEEAIKEHTTQIEAKVPVSVAAFLLNEKRQAMHVIEQRHQVNVFVIPDPHLETPHYHVTRFRQDTSSEERSYTRISEPQEATYTPQRAASAPKAQHPSRQHKDTARITRTTRQARIQAAEKPSLLKRCQLYPRSLYPSRETRTEAKNTTHTDTRHAQTRRPLRQTPKSQRDTSSERQHKATRPAKEQVQLKTPTSDNNRKADQVQERRERRQLRQVWIEQTQQSEQAQQTQPPKANKPKKAKVADKVADISPEKQSTQVIETKVTPVSTHVAEITAPESVNTAPVDNTETARTENTRRTRRSPRHLRAAGQRRKRDDQPGTPEGSASIAPIITSDTPAPILDDALMAYTLAEQEAVESKPKRKRAPRQKSADTSTATKVEAQLQDALSEIDAKPAENATQDKAKRTRHTDKANSLDSTPDVAPAETSTEAKSKSKAKPSAKAAKPKAKAQSSAAADATAPSATEVDVKDSASKSKAPKAKGIQAQQ